MNFKQYQAAAKKTAIYPDDARITYPLLGLSGEVGELCNKFKKVIRDQKSYDPEDLKGELGDILWYLSAVATDLGLSLDEIALKNVDKLHDRQIRGVLGGSGDKR